MDCSVRDNKEGVVCTVVRGQHVEKCTTRSLRAGQTLDGHSTVLLREWFRACH